jgi:hypothetical protein
VLALVKAFLKAGILTELGENQDTLTAPPGLLSEPRSAHDRVSSPGVVKAGGVPCTVPRSSCR